MSTPYKENRTDFYELLECLSPIKFFFPLASVNFHQYLKKEKRGSKGYCSKLLSAHIFIFYA